MNDIDLDRYFKNHELRADLEAQARRERAQAVGKLLVAAVRWLARLPARRRIYALGRVQDSDHARQQLDAGLPNRSCMKTFAVAALPLTESCALRAGRNVE